MGKNNKRLTILEINDRLRSRGITISGDYVNGGTKTEFTCICGNKWLAQPRNILNANTGCTTCSKKRVGDLYRSSKEKVNEKIKSSGITLIGDYTTKEIKTMFRHECGHEWLAKPGNILNGKGCPACANSGFNPNREAWAYILSFENFVKYGITNNIKSRMHAHKATNGEFSIVKTKHYPSGSKAREWENNIKRIFGGKYVTKDICPDGWTETLSHTMMNELMKTLS